MRKIVEVIWGVNGILIGEAVQRCGWVWEKKSEEVTERRSSYQAGGQEGPLGAASLRVFGEGCGELLRLAMIQEQYDRRLGGAEPEMAVPQVGRKK